MIQIQTGQRRYCCSCAILSSLVIAGLGCAPADTSSTTSLLSIQDPSELQLGDVWAATGSVRRVTFCNSSKDTIFVTSISPACNCVNVRPTTFAIPAGGNEDVYFTFDHIPPIWEWSKKTPFAPNKIPFDSMFKCTLRQGHREWQEAWGFSGQIRNPISITPAHIELDYDPSDANLSKDTILKFHTQMDVATIDARSSDEGLFHTSVERIDGHTFSIRVEANEGLRGFCQYPFTHTVSSAMRVRAESRENHLVMETRIPISVSIKRSIEVSPDTTIIGPAFVGTAQVAQIYLQPRREDDSVTILSVQFDESKIDVRTLDGAPVQAGAHNAIEIHKSVKISGKETDVVDLVAMTESSEAVPIRLQIHTIGVSK